MPVHVSQTPFASVRRPTKLRMPQARILKALMPADPTGRRFFWPLITRANLMRAIGYADESGAGIGHVGRTLVGRQATVKNKRIVGMIELGLVEVEVFRIEGVGGGNESNYCITAAGIRAYQVHVALYGEPPPHQYRGKKED